MLIVLKNHAICLSIDTLGAQMMSLKRGDTEYLWQGDARYWDSRAPILFPFIGRLQNNCYRLGDKCYTMGIHGFAAQSEFVPTQQTEDHVVLTLESSAATLQCYPFDFSLNIIYRLVDNRVEITFAVRNLGQNTMPFAIGGHPGFRVPIGPQERFEDYCLEFAAPCQPDRIGFTPQVLLSGQDERYPLQEDRRLPLRHELFDDDAIILKNMCREITLYSECSQHKVQISYPQMPYLGIWHWPKTDAPYVCIEPWTSLPARDSVTEELSLKSDMLHLPSGELYENIWSITIGE